MLGQKKNRFDVDSTQGINQNLSVILKRAPSKHENLILNKEMKETCKLSENVMPCCEFSVDDTGYYHVSSQITIKNTSTKPVLVEYLQFGVCHSDFEDYRDNLKSMIMNSNCHPEYVIADNICAIIHLKREEKYNLWINFGCENSTSFEFQSDYSNLRIYKL